MIIKGFFGEMPERVEKIYRLASEEYEKRGVFFLDRDYILNIHRHICPFPTIIDDLIKSADRLSGDSERALFALFAYRLLCDLPLLKENIERLDFDYDNHPYLAFILLLPTIQATRENLICRAVPEDIIENTLCHYEECVLINLDRHGVRGLRKRYFKWLLNYVECKILNIDRLRFEISRISDFLYVLEDSRGARLTLFGGGDMKENGMCAQSYPGTSTPAFKAEFKETPDAYIGHRLLENGRCSEIEESFSKSEYRLILTPNDDCLAVHIPPKSKGAFTPEICEENYKRAIDVFKKSYPELNIKAFRCRSWMLSEELRAVLPGSSNIIGFMNRFTRYPIPSGGEDVFLFVFKTDSCPPENLPERTSLQRSLKEIYLSGERVYEYGGIITL